jgi:hypothetical protein
MSKLTIPKKIGLGLLVLLLSLVAACAFLYRDMLFRDYENSDLVGHSETISILFVGNSHVFWGKVPNQLYAISKAHGIGISYKDISSNGAHLSNAYDEAVREMERGKYDYVVLQDNTRLLPGGIGGFVETIRLLCDEARQNGAIPVLYNPISAKLNGRPDEARLNIHSEAYRKAADESGAILVNAGGAWAYTYNTIPDISLYAWDGMHANNAGGFLTACVFAATLFDIRVEAVPEGSRYRGKDAHQIAQAAWEFVKRSN